MAQENPRKLSHTCLLIGIGRYWVRRPGLFFDFNVNNSKYWSFLILVDATLCGMVALCAGANVVEPYAAAFIGFLASFVFMTIEHNQMKLHLDDPLGSIAVHFGGGILGLLLLPFFMRERYGAEEGMLYWKGCSEDVFTVEKYGEYGNWKDGDCMYTPFYQFGWHLFGALVIILWTAFCCVLIFWPLSYFNLLRVEPDTEIRGIDIKVHGEPAYPLAAQGHGYENEGQFSVMALEKGKLSGGLRSQRALVNPNRMSSWNVQEGISENGLAALAKAHKKALSLHAEEDDPKLSGEENSSFAIDTVSDVVFDESNNDVRKVSFQA